MLDWFRTRSAHVSNVALESNAFLNQKAGSSDREAGSACISLTEARGAAQTADALR